jgi:hypothetical protein
LIVVITFSKPSIVDFATGGGMNIAIHYAEGPDRGSRAADENT